MHFRILKQEMSEEKKQEQQDSLQVLADRFRKERQRLNLSFADVAHYCGVSVSSVFNWDAGRAKIPLSAAQSLWEYGFDVEAVVKGTEQPVEIPRVADGQDLDEPSGIRVVPRHMLLRHGASQQTAFAYLNLPFSDEFAKPGEVLVMKRASNETVPDIAGESVLLFRPDNPGNREFLCEVRPAGRGKIRVRNGKSAYSCGTRTFLGKGNALGVFLYRLGTERHGDVPRESHGERFSWYLRCIGVK